LAGARVEVAAEILDAARHHDLIAQSVGDRAVDAARRRHPGRRDEAVIYFRPQHAVELRRLVMLVDVADRNEVDSRRPPVELIDDLEIDPQLLDVDFAVHLVVPVRRKAAMLPFELGIEDDVVGDGVGRQQHHAADVGAALPLTAGGRILRRAEQHLAIGADRETRNGRIGQAEDCFVAGFLEGVRLRRLGGFGGLVGLVGRRRLAGCRRLAGGRRVRNEVACRSGGGEIGRPARFASQLAVR
jgi:hypothetical protein